MSLADLEIFAAFRALTNHVVLPCLQAAEKFGLKYGMHTLLIGVGVFHSKKEFSAKNDVNLAGTYIDNIKLDGVPVDQGMRVVVMKAGTPGPVLDAMAPCPGPQAPKPNMADPAVAGAVFMRSATTNMSGLIAPAVKKAFEKVCSPQSLATHATTLHVAATPSSWSCFPDLLYASQDQLCRAPTGTSIVGEIYKVQPVGVSRPNQAYHGSRPV